MYKSSLFPVDFYVTQGFHNNHKACDLSTGKCYTDFYSPKYAGDGIVWKIITKYTFKITTKELHEALRRAGKFNLGSWKGPSTITVTDAPIVWIKHDNGWGTRYIHMQKNHIYVSVGQRIVAGKTRIGKIGNAGVSLGCHLHHELLIKYSDITSAVDPLPFIKNEGKLKPSSPVEEKDGKLLFTVRNGKWRSNIIQEIINSKYWSGNWEDHLEHFNSLNPVTPQGGWKKGDKVIVGLVPKPKEIKPSDESTEIISTKNGMDPQTVNNIPTQESKEDQVVPVSTESTAPVNTQEKMATIEQRKSFWYFLVKSLNYGIKVGTGGALLNQVVSPGTSWDITLLKAIGTFVVANVVIAAWDYIQQEVKFNSIE